MRRHPIGPLRLGLLGARADCGGLAAQTREFHRHLRPDRTLVVDLGAAGRGPADLSWYPDATVTRGVPSPEVLDGFLDGLDVVWAFETPYAPYAFDRARMLGVRSVLYANPELWHADVAPPDVVLAPTTWRLDLLPPGAAVLPFPVARDRLPFRRRTGAATFVHVAAPAMLDRNGTDLVLAAARYVRTRCRLVVRGRRGRSHRRGNVEIVYDPAEPADYWAGWCGDGDVLLLPRRYAGLCMQVGTLIATPWGDKPIETLEVGDWVLDDTGCSRVSGVVRRVVPEVVRINVRGVGLVTSLTHRHLSAATAVSPLEETEAADVSQGSWLLACPPIRSGIERIRVGPRPTRKGLSFTWSEDVDLDAGWARLLGLWLAEGWTGRYPQRDRRIPLAVTCWSFGPHEKLLADETVELLAERDIRATVRFAENGQSASFGSSGTWLVRCRSLWFAEFLAAANVGSGARGKRVPDLVDHLVLPLVGGWLEGDGHLSVGRTVTGWSESPNLVFGMWRLLQKVGIFGSISCAGRRLNVGRHRDAARICEHVRRFTLADAVRPERVSRWMRDDPAGWRTRVLAIERRSSATEVIGIETGSGRYIANGFLTHNSLPMQEALSVGMPVISLNVPPQNGWLPPETLVPPRPGREHRMAGGTVRVHSADPAALARVWDRLATDPALVARCSDLADAHAGFVSWDALLPSYRAWLLDAAQQPGSR